MAAPLVQKVEIDTSSAQRQIAQLEQQLSVLNNPINIPVDITADQSISNLRRDVAQADNQFGDLNREIAETDSNLRQVGRSADRAGRDLEDAGTRGGNAFRGLIATSVSLIGAVAAFQGIGAIFRGAGSAIQAASDLEESLSKTNVVFEEFSGNIQDFASRAPQALGLSTAAALEATSTFGNLFVALGLSREAAADLSPDIVQLAADLASFNNIPVGEAVEKLRSGLVGEAEPLRVLGVNLTEATVAAKALELGLAGSNGVISEAAKVQARYALILEQTVTAQGDYARTADGVANRQRTLSAEFENLRVKIGEALLPAFEALLDQGPEIIATLEGLVPVIEAIGQAIASTDFAGFIQGVADISRSLVNIPGVLQGIRDDWFDTGMGNQTLTQSRLTQSLVESLRAGEDPAKTLANVLAELGRTDLNPDQFKEVSTALIQLTNLKPTRLADLSQLLRREGEAAGFTADEVQFLREQLVALQDVQRRQPGGGHLPGDDPQSAIIISETAQAILDLALAGEQIGQFSLDIGIDGITEPFILLQGALEAARGAIEDDTGAIIQDLDTFFADLNTNLEAQLSFAANLATLRIRGLFNLADLFEELGPEAAGLLADAVTNPAAAAEEEARLEEHARRMMRAEAGAAISELTGLLAGVQLDPLVIPLTFGGLPDVPISALTAGGVGIGGQVSENITVNQFFATEPAPTTTTARAAAEVNSIVAGTRGRQ